MAQTSIRVQDSAKGEFDYAEKFEDERTVERVDKRAALPRASLGIVDLDQSQSRGGGFLDQVPFGLTIAKPLIDRTCSRVKPWPELPSCTSQLLPPTWLISPNT